MKRPVFSFRPNLKEGNHRRAWEILSHVPEGEKTAYLVNAVLFYEQAAGLEEMVRRAVWEELKGRSGSEMERPQEAQTKENEIPEQMLEFLTHMEEL